MKKLKKVLVAFLFISCLLLAYNSFSTNTCMRQAHYFPSFITMDVKANDKDDYKRFKRTEDAMKEFGRYVPLPKDEPYLVACTFGEVTYVDGEPVQFAHYVENKIIEMDVRKGSEWEYNKDLRFGKYYYRVSKEPFEYSLETSKFKDAKTITLDDGVEALLLENLMEWKDDRFYYQLYHLSFIREDQLTFLANSSRYNMTFVPEWANEIK